MTQMKSVEFKEFIAFLLFSLFTRVLEARVALAALKEMLCIFSFKIA